MTTLPANNSGTEDTGEPPASLAGPNGQPSPVAPESADDRVQAALREYLERVDRGESPDRDDFVAKRPEIAEELRSCLEAEERIRKLAESGGPNRRSATSTQSFALHGQETIAPRNPASRPSESGSGLKQQFGRYRVIKALGKGAMGMVYLAEDSQLLRQVALKTPHFEQEPTPELLERFYREARAAANLNHPNICPVHDVGQIDGTHYISMAFIDGHPLSAFISAKPQAERQILIVVRKLAQALSEAHEHGIVHRDLKPANIMVDKRNEPIIMDFGLARQLQREGQVRITQSGMLIGTPAYMSPEQIDGEPGKVGPASDQFSLGVILYELLTGQLPFRGSLSAVMAQILTKDPVPPSQLRADLDLRIEALCLKMLAKDPVKRFPSLVAVADEIAGILRTPNAKQTAPAKSSGAKPSTPAPTGATNAQTSGIRQSVTKKSLVASAATASLAVKDLVSLEELAQKCLARHDYDQVIQIVERIPESKRTGGLEDVLAAARAKADEVAFLICEIDEAIRFKDQKTILNKADELLKIKPGHHRALKAKEEWTGYGKGGAAQLGPLASFTRPWSEGGWIPWSVLAFGLAVAGIVYAIVVVQIGKTAVIIDIQDPGIRVAIKDKANKIELFTGQSENNKVEVTAGDQELKVSYAGLETRTRRFEIKSGQKRRVTVSLVNKELVAKLDQDSLPFVENVEKAGPGKAIGPDAGGATKKVALVPTKTASPPAAASIAAGTRAPIAPAASDGFVSLFNGRDLTGWKTDPSQPGNWRVENGVLIGSGSDVSHLYTERDDYADFHLRLEARISERGNSGIDFRTTFGPRWPVEGPKFPLGYEAQIDNDNHAARTGSLFVMDGGNRSGRAVVSIHDTLVSPGDWFAMEVIAQGEHIEIKVNGRKVASRDDSHFAKGHIALQQFEPQTVVEFRKVEMKELASAGRVTAPAAKETEPHHYVPLFNGRDLAGWKTHPSQPGNWRVENGLLVGSGPGQTSHLYTERGDFKDFRLRVEARVNEGGNSGVYYRAKFGPKYPAKQPRWLLAYNAKLDGARLGAFLLDNGAPNGPLMIRTRDPQPPGGGWVVLEVIVRGNHITIKTDGEITAEYTDEKRHFESGYIALQQHTPQTRVEFRKIEIEELDSLTSVAAPPEHVTAEAKTLRKKGGNLLVNGSFEDGPPPGDFHPFNPGSTSIPGWKVTRGQVDLLGLHKSVDGANSIDLHGSPGFGGIEQIFGTTKGHRYRVTFSLTVSPEARHRVKKMAASAAGTQRVFTADSKSTSWKNVGWATRTFEFTAVADETTLEFYTLDKRDPVAGPLIDNVRVVEVAEK